jgi:tRNA nucleotidyltransferase (CCA-adding enzyme)
VFFETLRDCAALAVIFPEIDALFGVPQPARWHPEIDTGIHTLMVLTAAAALSPDPAVRFAALMHDLGKAETPPAEWPSHHGHEERGAGLILALAARLRVPVDYRELALLVARYHGLAHRALELRPETLLELFERADAFRRPERFLQALLAFEADARGRTGFETRDYPQQRLLKAARDAAAAVKPSAADLATQDGGIIAGRLRADRIAAVRACRTAFH